MDGDSNPKVVDGSDGWRCKEWEERMN
jgi:hypothetical protein